MSDSDHTQPISLDSLASLGSDANEGMVAQRYRIERLLGVGGMGRVYQAHDTELDEMVALKMLRPDLLESGDALTRFRQEVKLARQVTHENVARIFDIGEHAGQKFMTMEFIDGRALVDELATRGQYDEHQALRTFAAMCRGVAMAHERGIVHRDLKPGNVMIEKGGRVVVTDFGLARSPDSDAGQLTMGQVVGTPAYMAPEQVAAMPLGPAADVYALGLILFELLAGRPVWRGSSPVMVAAARMMEDAPRVSTVRLDVSAEVDALVARCLARDPEARFADAGELARALDPLLDRASSGHSSGAAGGEQTMLQPAKSRRVAVLPFAHGGEDGDARLSVGLREDLIDVLSMTPGLRVRHGGEPGGDALEQGRALDVDVVVGGTVRRRDATLRVSARVTGVADGFSLWAGRFERPLSEATALNDEVAERVAEALSAGHAPKRGIRQAPGAVELYLELREAQHRGFGGAPGDTQAMMAKLDEAARVAPDDPLITAAILTMRIHLGNIFGRTEVTDEVTMQLRRLQATAPHLPGTWLAKGVVEFYGMHAPVAAVVSLRRALALDPGHVETLGVLGFVLTEAGCLPEAEALTTRALWSDPSAPSIRATKAHGFALRGDWTALVQTIREIDLARWQVQRQMLLGRYSLWSGRQLWRDDEVLVGDAPPVRAAAFSRRVFHREAKPTELEDFSNRYLHHAAPGSRAAVFMRQMIAEICAYLGDLDQAWTFVEQAHAAGEVDALWLAQCPVLAPLRERDAAKSMIAADKARGDEIRAAYESPLTPPSQEPS